MANTIPPSHHRRITTPPPAHSHNTTTTAPLYHHMDRSLHHGYFSIRGCVCIQRQALRFLLCSCDCTLHDQVFVMKMTLHTLLKLFRSSHCASFIWAGALKILDSARYGDTLAWVVGCVLELEETMDHKHNLLSCLLRFAAEAKDI
nr:hypothetical protein [Tanacetum cinerariifolium]